MEFAGQIGTFQIVEIVDLVFGKLEQNVFALSAYDFVSMHHKVSTGS
jgi:hypothetical protein